MYSFSDFWRRRLANVERITKAANSGWMSPSTPLAGFVEPSLGHRFGNDPEKASIVIISAPGAVGKTVYSRQLASIFGLAMLDLAQAGPVGENSFTGGAFRSLGDQGPNLIREGRLGVIVDALDEAQIKVTPEAYAAFLRDIAGLKSEATPIILVGRTVAAEDAWSALVDDNIDAAILEIEFFDEARSHEFVEKFFSQIDDGRVATHRQVYISVAAEIVDRLRSALEGDPNPDAFSGYAPVLDAVCRSVADEDNPKAMIENLGGNAPLEILAQICNHILEREQGKFATNFSRVAEERGADLQQLDLYTPEEQRERLWNAVFGGRYTPSLTGLPSELKEQYDASVRVFMQQHPFLDGSGARPANIVFGADLAARLLLRVGDRDQGFDFTKSAIMRNPFLFHFYEQLRRHADKTEIPAFHVAFLHSSLRARVEAGQRVFLEIIGDGEKAELDLFMTAPGDDDDLIELTGTVMGDELQLTEGLTDIFIDAERLQLAVGNFDPLVLEAPIFINVGSLYLTGSELFARKHKNFPEEQDEEQDTWITLVAKEMIGVGGLENRRPTVFAGTKLELSWPGAESYPWTDFSVPAPEGYADNSNDPEAVSKNVSEAYRQLRRLVLAFRSHSRGALKRVDAKIENKRMMKGDIGAALLSQMLEDQILQSGKFYTLDAERLGELVGTDYGQLTRGECSEKCKQYLTTLARGILP